MHPCSLSSESDTILPVAIDSSACATSHRLSLPVLRGALRAFGNACNDRTAVASYGLSSERLMHAEHGFYQCREIRGCDPRNVDAATAHDVKTSLGTKAIDLHWRQSRVAKHA